MSLPDIPHHWSAEQALAVYELLEALGQSVWDTYQTPLVELIQSQLDEQHTTDPGSPGQTDDFNDDIPF